jgi:hypothetical protein
LKNALHWIGFVIVLIALNYPANAEDGHALWLKYNLVPNQRLLQQYRERIKGTIVEGEEMKRK